jgi:hypothetical protein
MASLLLTRIYEEYDVLHQADVANILGVYADEEDKMKAVGYIEQKYKLLASLKKDDNSKSAKRPRLESKEPSSYDVNLIDHNGRKKIVTLKPNDEVLDILDWYGPRKGGNVYDESTGKRLSTRMKIKEIPNIHKLVSLKIEL